MGLQNLVRGFAHADDVVVLQVDCANAFNCIDRNAVLTAVRAHAPDLSAWADFCYGRHSMLHCGGPTLFS